MADGTITAGEVEQGARNLHPKFDQRTATSRILREHLYRKASDLLAQAVGMYPDPFLTCEFEYSLPPPDFVSGEEFPASLYRRAGRVEFGSGVTRELHLVPQVDLTCPPFWPAAAIVGNRIYLGGSASRWAHGLRLTVHYVPPITLLSGTDSTFDPLPDYAESVLVAEAGLFMARRAEIPTGEFATERDEARAAFLTTATGYRRAVHKKVRRYR